MQEWKYKHGLVIKQALEYINSKSDDFILKGGTALKQCYGLDRFSEDIDLDSQNREIEKYIKEFCEKNKYTYNAKKDTDTVKRYMINYGNESKPLKIEISYRKKEIDPYTCDKVNGINVYDIDTIAAMKANAYSSRNKIRDLYDVTFICNNYLDELSEHSKLQIQEAMLSKGLDYFDYIIENQDDELIDKEKLVEDFLNAWDKIGLNTDPEERERYNTENAKQKSVDELIHNAKLEIEAEPKHTPNIHIDHHRGR